MLKAYFKLQQALRNFRDDQSGASLAEYALLLGLITVAVAATIGLLAGTIDTVIGNAEDVINPGP